MQNKTCAFLTMQDPGNFVMDYELCFDAMAAHGWTVETVCWRTKEFDWDRFDAVYLCTAWDYPDHIDEFVALLGQIEASSTTLVNELSLVLWNMRKTYLRDLESTGAEIVPSLWFAGIDGASIDDWFAEHGTDTVIAKPEVGANAIDTFVLREPVDADTKAMLHSAFNNRPFFVRRRIQSCHSEDASRWGLPLTGRVRLRNYRRAARACAAAGRRQGCGTHRTAAGLCTR